MLKPGAKIPDVYVWTAPNERASLHELAAEGPLLLLFYVFDWSST